MDDGMDTVSTLRDDSVVNRHSNLLRRYHRQLLIGCNRIDCTNPDCASSGQVPTLTADEAAARAIKLLTSKAHLCYEGRRFEESVGVPEDAACASETGGPAPSEDYLISPSVEHLINNSFENNLGDKSAKEGLETLRFDIEDKAEEPALVLSVESVRDIKTSEAESGIRKWIGQVFSDPRTFYNSFLVEEGERVTLDLGAARECLKEVLVPMPCSPYLDTISTAVKNLADTVEYNLKYHQAFQRNPNCSNLFAIIFELPILQEPEFMRCALPAIMMALTHLHIDGKLSIVKLWSNQGHDWLIDKVQSVHQFITVRLLEKMTHTRRWPVNEDTTLAAAVRLLYMLYCASIIGGKGDSQLELLRETEFHANEDEDLTNFMKSGVANFGDGAPDADWQMDGPEHLTDEEEMDNNTPTRTNDVVSWYDPLEAKLGLRRVDVTFPLVADAEFVSEILCEVLELENDFLNLKSHADDRFAYLQYPFVLNTSIKMQAMYLENRVRMHTQRRRAVFQSILGRAEDPYLRLHISRDNAVIEAMTALELLVQDSPLNLRKQLRVVFAGEPGIDEGGISKEFYQIVFHKLFDPVYGMFTYNESTRLFWFNPIGDDCTHSEYTLIGILFGLAIYNNIIVDVRFPSVVYRKLFGKLGNFEDLKQMEPVLYSSLQSLLDHPDDDIEEVFCFSFRITYKDVYGTYVNHDLKPNGDNIKVNIQNRKEFVRLYANFLLNESVQKQFAAFRKGFRMVTRGSPLMRLFQPIEVEQLICGITTYDFEALESSVRYDGGFDSDHPTIKYFWNCVHAMTDDQKKLLLEFTTGSDRAPIGGLAMLKFIIAKNGPDSDRLPTAHTCFNVLLLPEYSTEEKLKERVLKAITNSRGFGLQ